MTKCANTPPPPPPPPPKILNSDIDRHNSGVQRVTDYLLQNQKLFVSTFGKFSNVNLELHTI
jgi:hypothetical protein